MKSNNIRKLILCIIAAILIPLRVSGAAYWQGNNVFNPDEGTLWGVTKDEIVKVTDYKGYTVLMILILIPRILQIIRVFLATVSRIVFLVYEVKACLCKII